MTKNQSRLPNMIPEDDDSYTLTRYIAGQRGLYGPLRFTYRPVPAIRLAQFRDATENLSEVKLLDSLCQAAAAHLVSWDAIDHRGQPMRTDWRTVRQLAPELATRFFMIVIHSASAGDEDPEAAPAATNDAWFAPPEAPSEPEASI